MYRILCVLFFSNGIHMEERTRPDRPWAHPTSYTMGTGSFPGVKWSGRGVDHEKDGQMYVPYIVCFFQ